MSEIYHVRRCIVLDDDVVLYDGHRQTYLISINKTRMQMACKAFLMLESTTSLKMYFIVYSSYFTIVEEPRCVPINSHHMPLRSIKLWRVNGSQEPTFHVMSYILKGIAFDLNLIKYCEGEDIDYSYRVFASSAAYSRILIVELTTARPKRHALSEWNLL